MLFEVPNFKLYELEGGLRLLQFRIAELNNSLRDPGQR